MKRKQFNIVLSLLFVLALFGSQIAAGYLHDRHDAHRTAKVIAPEQNSVQAHGEHCRICSIDLFHILFTPDHFVIDFQSSEQIFCTPFKVNFSYSYLVLCFGRAPPILA